MPKSPINTLSRSQDLMLYPLWFVTWLWTRTLRFKVTPEVRAQLSDTSEATVVLFWHNRLLLASEIYRRWRLPHLTYGLVSASKDGAWLAGFVERLGLMTVRGSSSRGGREALFALSARLSEGSDVVITPDGPRGPLYSFQPGAAILARRCKTRVLLIGSSAAPAWRLKSWDRFILPWPFSTITLESRMFAPADLPADLKGTIEVLRSTLSEMNKE